MPETTYHHGNLRSALLSAARELLEAEGVGGISMRAVARRAGVSHAAPYHHFADRDALLAAVATQGFDALASRLATVAEAHADPRERLEHLGRAYVEQALAEPACFRLMMRPELTGGAEGPTELAASAQDAFAHLVRAVADLRPDLDPARAVIAPWCLVHGLAALTIDGALSGVEIDPIEVVRPLLDGLTREGENG